MKKLIALIMVLTLSVSCITVVVHADTKKNNEYSKQPNQETIRFNEKKYESIRSEKEKGKAKLLDSGYSEVCVNNIPDETLEVIASAKTAEQTVSYYTETEQNGSINLVKLSKKDFNAISDITPDVDPNEVIVIDEKGQPISKSSDATTKSITSSIDGGTVKVITTMYSVSSSTPSHYQVVSSFQWTKMPSYRGTDIFGITRDSNTVYKPGTFGNYTYNQTVKRNWYASSNGPIFLNESYTSTQKNNLANSDSSTAAFAIKHSLPADYIPGSVLAGTFYSTTQHYNLQGAVWYQGYLKQPSIQPTNFNHWSTYQHQKSITWGSPTISYPWGASITISPTSNYSTPVVDVILNTWKNNTLY